MRTAASRPLAALLVAALALTGCGSEDGGSGGSPDPGTEQSEQSGEAATDSGDPGPEADDGTSAGDGEQDAAWREADEPLVAYLGFDPETEPDVVAAWDAVEEARVACMAGVGQEYIALPFETTLRESRTEAHLAESSSREWAEEWGFGISTRMFNAAQVGPDLRSQPVGDGSAAGDDGVEDPNAAHVAGLSPEGANAYREAAMDCLTEQIRNGLDGRPHEGETAELLDLIDGLGGESLTLDPAVAEYERGVADCVADAGFTYTTIHETMDGFVQEAYAIMAPYTESSGPDDPRTEGDLVLPLDQRLPDESLATLAGIQEREIETALATWDCGGGEAAYWDLIDELARQEQVAFIDSHSEALEPYRRA